MGTAGRRPDSMIQAVLLVGLVTALAPTAAGLTLTSLEPPALRLRISRIEVNSIQMTWHLRHAQESKLNVSGCRLLYRTSGGPQLLILTGLRHQERTFSLHLPHGDWSYSLRLSCPGETAAVTSNLVRFTFEPLSAGAPTLLPYRSPESERAAAASQGAAVSYRSPAQLPAVPDASSNIPLGVGCGVVGLVVVNTVLILMIRRYTRHRQRRRRQQLFKTFGPGAFEDEELVYHITA